MLDEAVVAARKLSVTVLPVDMWKFADTWLEWVSMVENFANLPSKECRIGK